MSSAPEPPRGFLSPLRVLDLSDERGLLAGWMLARLGADVVHCEPRGGTRAREAGPFAPDAPHLHRSLYWSAYGAGRRSIVCDLGERGGRELFSRLAARADALIESGSPASLPSAVLDLAALRAENPGLVHVGITPFGSGGPKDEYADSDLVLWAAGGALAPSRASSGVPLRISVPQTWLHAAADAAAGALIAVAARRATGRGQRVEVSAQQSVSLATLSTTLAAAVGHANFQFPADGPRRAKQLDLSGSGARTRRSKWPVADGLLEMHLGMGPASGGSVNRLFAWMRESGALPAEFRDWDWVELPKRILADDISEEQIDRAREAVAAFVRPMRKQALLEAAMQRGILMAPAMTIGDLLASPHLQARGYFETVDEQGEARTLPSRFAAGCADAFVPLRAAPRPGEHDAEVRAEWLGDAAPRAKPSTRHRDRNGGGDGDGARAMPFTGLRVMDLAWVVAGPLIGRTLADFGATVVRVESSKRIETARLMGPFPGGRSDPQQSVLFENCNANKLGLALDLSMQAAREVALDLAGWADVVIESFMPGQMAKFGLGYEQLAQRNPGLVMLSTSLMGQSGPYAQFSGYGNVGAALAGYQLLVGERGELPIGPFGPYTDYVGPRFALVTLLAALERRRETGRGCLIDVSQAEAGIAFLAPQIAERAATGRDAGALGNRDPAYAPHGVFRAAGVDRWVAIVARDEAEWLRLAALIGGAALAGDPRFATLESRKTHEDVLEQLVGQWTATRDALEIERLLQAEGISAHVVATTDDFCADPQLLARGHFVRLPHPLMGETVFEAARQRLSDTPACYERSAPTFGRDAQYVLGTLLRYDRTRIEALRAAGALN